MDDNSRREHLKMLLGMAALGGTPLAALAASAKSQEVVPPQGIGYRIAHISYSDQGGRPDGMQHDCRASADGKGHRGTSRLRCRARSTLTSVSRHSAPVCSTPLASAMPSRGGQAPTATSRLRLNVARKRRRSDRTAAWPACFPQTARR